MDNELEKRGETFCLLWDLIACYRLKKIHFFKSCMSKLPVRNWYKSTALTATQLAFVPRRNTKMLVL